MEQVTLARGDQILKIAPDVGGALLAWKKGGRDIFRPVKNPALLAQRGEAIAAYPLIPYSNRIASGTFSFGGEIFRLAPNMSGELHSIHGNGWENVWKTGHRTEDSIVLVYDHNPAESEGKRKQWPFAYRGVLSYALVSSGLKVGLVIENRDTREQPAGLGFHPFIAVEPDSLFSFRAQGVWLNGPAHLPEKWETCAGEWDFAAPALVRKQVLDNCFTGFGGQAEVVTPGFQGGLRLKADALFSCLVVFHPEKGDFIALEPVSNMNDAVHHHLTQSGMFTLRPGERKGGEIVFETGAGKP